MSKETSQSSERERRTLPIEKGFPIERVNEIAAKEGLSGRYYRPIYTMHKWWARRLGCVFRSICLYSLLDDPENIDVSYVEDPDSPQAEGTAQAALTGGESIQRLIDEVSISNPESLWDLYTKDVRINDKKVLDPFMGGGTSLVEASRFGVEADGYDLNPVAWFVTKKELEAAEADLEKLQSEFDRLYEEVSNEILDYYKTPCPNVGGDHEADVMYYFWVKELNCVDCGHSVPLFNDYRVAKGRYENDDKYNVLCPDCNSGFLVDDWREETTCTVTTAEGEECGHTFTPDQGTVIDSQYTCTKCGSQYGITDAISEQNGYDLRLYAIEYYCEECDQGDRKRSEVKGYKRAEGADKDLYREAVEEWESTPQLREYIPDESISEGAITAASEVSGNDVFQHGYDKWSDMFNERQLLCLSKILSNIDEIEEQDIREYFLLCFSETLNYNTMMTYYNPGKNLIANIFNNNSFDPPQRPVENNIWGTKYGTGTFQKMWDMIEDGIEYAQGPYEKYLEEGDKRQTPPFDKPIGENVTATQRDMRLIDAENEYDAIITDPPYYKNIIYSEVSDYFYVWQKILLEDEYDCFTGEKTPRKESIVVNPYLGKNSEDFESELREAFTVLHRAIKKRSEGADQDGVIAFTYHHSDSESWGELLESLCDVGFEITATYPISADISKFISGETVEFDIIIVARPAHEYEPISWNSLRRDIYRTAQKTRQRLEENRELSRGDIGVVEMGRCFHEYSKHHGKVERAGETMTAKEVVDEIYGVIQHGSDIGEIDVFLDLLETPNASYDDLSKLTRGTNATSERMEDMRLYRMDDGFNFGTWDDEKRIVYIQSQVENDEDLTDLDKAQFLRWRWEQGKSISEYLERWEITDDLRELCEGLADATGDETYRNILESRLSDF